MKKLLIVEDDTHLQRAYRRWFKSVDLTIVSSGEEGVEFIEKQEPDLIITDQDLGRGMDGLDFADWARAKAPDAKLLVVSGGAWVEDAARRRGHDFMPKPLSMLDVEERLGIYKCGWCGWHEPPVDDLWEGQDYPRCPNCQGC